MSAVMRAKMRVNSVTSYGDPVSQEQVSMSCVAKKDGYPADGSDEDNTFAKYSPSGNLQITIANPNLVGKIKEGNVYYLDFTAAEQ